MAGSVSITTSFPRSTRAGGSFGTALALMDSSTSIIFAGNYCGELLDRCISFRYDEFVGNDRVGVASFFFAGLIETGLKGKEG